MLTEGLAIIEENLLQNEDKYWFYDKGTWNIIQYITLYAQIISLDPTPFPFNSRMSSIKLCEFTCRFKWMFKLWFKRCE